MEEYYETRDIPNQGRCGLIRMIFTVGLAVGIDEEGNYLGRYCFPSNASAKASILKWDGSGDPPGNWIKYKGTGGERINQQFTPYK